MKKTSLFLIPIFFSSAVMAKAGESTLSFGYLNVKSGGEKKLTEKADTTKPDPEGIATVYADGYSKAGGAFVRYRYEFSDDWGIISSFAYSKTDYSTPITLNVDKNTSKHTSNIKGDYMSLMAGPTYRINEYVSVYGLVGLGYSNVNFDLDVTKYGKKTFSKSSTSLAYGVGMQVNVYEGVTVDVGYERSGSGEWKTDAFTVGVGYKF